jgi:hypothetical protein
MLKIHGRTKKAREKQRRWFFLNCFLVVLSVLLPLFLGCNLDQNITSQLEENPFTVVWAPGHEHVVTFSGFSSGHIPEETSEFMLKLNNHALIPWSGRYFVDLLDTESIVMNLAQGEFNIPSEGESEITIEVVFHDKLSGAYGLSLYIPEREAQSIQTIYIGNRRTNTETGPWPSRATHPWIWPDVDSSDEETAFTIAEAFVTSSPTYIYDGIPDSLELTDSIKHAKRVEDDSDSITEVVVWEFRFKFKSRHAGYGDRSNEMVAQVVTPHDAVIQIEGSEIVFATLDGEWDMLEQALVDTN